MEPTISLTATSAPHELPDNEAVSGILTDHQAQVFDIVNFVILSSLIGWFGIAANVINILVFFQQGFTNTVNISLFGLGMADLSSLITLQWICICRNPLVVSAGAPWVLSDFMNLTGAWPHVVCGRISSFITAYVTAERCLCIITPLKVKQIVTPTRTTVTIVIIYILNILTLLPEYATSYLDWKIVAGTNRSLLAIRYTKGREKVDGLVFVMSSMTGMISFWAVIVFTFILVVKIKQTSTWRMGATTGISQTGVSQYPTMCSRDKKTVKMIVVIATILIGCYFPGISLTLTTFIEPEFNLRRRHINLAISLWSAAFVFQTINSSVNIFLYYSMSSNYRLTFHNVFSKCRPCKPDLIDKQLM